MADSSVVIGIAGRAEILARKTPPIENRYITNHTPRITKRSRFWSKSVPRIAKKLDVDVFSV